MGASWIHIRNIQGPSEVPMPRPPLFPTIDWKAVFESGLDWTAWLAQAESPQRAAGMDEDRRTLPLAPHVKVFLASLTRPVRVVAIAEDWCGDVVRHAPVLQRLSEAAPYLDIRYISRSQHPELFSRYLTNGGEAIPKFIFLSESWVECAQWGPMPEVCRELIARGKACGDVPAARRKVAALYETDPERRTVASELVLLLDIAASREP